MAFLCLLSISVLVLEDHRANSTLLAMWFHQSPVRNESGLMSFNPFLPGVPDSKGGRTALSLKPPTLGGGGGGVLGSVSSSPIFPALCPLSLRTGGRDETGPS